MKKRENESNIKFSKYTEIDPLAQHNCFLGLIIFILFTWKNIIYYSAFGIIS